MSYSPKKRILIRGGVKTKKLSRLIKVPMLHEVAASDLDLTTIVNPIRKMLKLVSFFAGEVETIDLSS